jgi:hypothetical protein
MCLCAANLASDVLSPMQAFAGEHSGTIPS